VAPSTCTSTIESYLQEHSRSRHSSAVRTGKQRITDPPARIRAMHTNSRVVAGGCSSRQRVWLDDSHALLESRINKSVIPSRDLYNNSSTPNRYAGGFLLRQLAWLDGGQLVSVERVAAVVNFRKCP